MKMHPVERGLELARLAAFWMLITFAACLAAIVVGAWCGSGP